MKVGLLLLVIVAGCGKEPMEEPMTGSIHSITWTSPTRSLTLYPSGLADVGSGWVRIDDAAALQKLFDRAKEGIRAKAYGSGAESPIEVSVWTTAATYRFRGDLLDLRDAALPSNQPFEFDNDGHSKQWSALKTGAIIDPKF